MFSNPFESFHDTVAAAKEERERLDRLLTISTPRERLLVAVIALSLGILVAWLFLGSVARSISFDGVLVEGFSHPAPYYNSPPAKGSEKLIEARLNNIPLGPATVEAGWLIFSVDPRQLAEGDNLVGVRVASRPPEARGEILIEKLELHLRYT